MERLLNQEAVDAFLQSEKRYEDLPTMYVELWLNEQNNHELSGQNNSEDSIGDGLRMECIPNDSLGGEILEVLAQEGANFPFEFYEARFTTFQGDTYSPYKKFLRHILIDTSKIGNEYAIREYVVDMYNTYATNVDIVRHQNEYRRLKTQFRQENFHELNERIDNYSFGLRNDNKSNLQADLTLIEENIGIENKGKGRQCFIKTEFALKKAEGIKNKIDIALIEEPENHLSHINMKNLISMIGQSDDKQLIIATHSNLISSRLDLRNTILLHSSTNKPVLLSDLPADTAEFFIKAPYHNILDFVLSKKVLLVEGDAEFILMEIFYEMVSGHSSDEENVHIYSVGGTSFKRYLDVAGQLAIKTAVVRDNDGDYLANCMNLYEEYTDENRQVFADQNYLRNTFEVCVYQDNEYFCEELFTAGRKTLTVQDWMLKNKSEAALRLLENMNSDFQIPEYIRNAIQWINA